MDEMAGLTNDITQKIAPTIRQDSVVFQYQVVHIFGILCLACVAVFPYLPVFLAGCAC